jgi:hypothetical protein
MKSACVTAESTADEPLALRFLGLAEVDRLGLRLDLRGLLHVGERFDRSGVERSGDAKPRRLGRLLAVHGLRGSFLIFTVRDFLRVEVRAARFRADFPR